MPNVDALSRLRQLTGVRGLFSLVRRVLPIVVGLLISVSTHAETRVALVIGNAAYRQVPALANPANDASDVAASLARLGFDVVRGVDLDYAGMRERVRQFGAKLDGADVAVFFYAGHGLQVAGKNYLAPVDVNLRSQADLEFGTVDLDVVLKIMEARRRTNIVLLDACRDNPLVENLAATMGTRSLGPTRGLAQTTSGVGTLIAYATQPGNIALDGRGRNSPFTGALLRAVERPGLSIGDVMVAVRNDVLDQTGGRQVPWDHSSLTGPFYFKSPPPAAGAPAANLDLAFWDTVKDSQNPRMLEAYLKRYPEGAFVDIARIRLESASKAAARPLATAPSDDARLGPDALKEVRDRLYELNFDPGSSAGEAGVRTAIRDFESQNDLPATGVATSGLLQRLRSLGGLRPWGSIVYDKTAGKWGASWGHESRREAVADARRSCGGAACQAEVSFFGAGCGAFARSGSGWSLVTRDGLDRAKTAALDGCGTRGGGCRVIGALCADGTGRSAN